MSAQLPTRTIGDTQVTAVGFGVMGLSVAYSKPLPDEERLKLLDTVYEHGCTNWDTADVYSDNEELLGKWFARTGKRSEIFLATKFGFKFGTNTSTIDGSPEYVRERFGRSLRLLGTEYVDLLYLHRPALDTPIEITVGAMAELVKTGKVRYLGLSDCSEATLRRAHAVHPIAALQVEYSPFTLDIEDEKIGLYRACQELGVAIVVYAPLARGLLTGQFQSPDDFAEGDFRRAIPRYSRENFPKILKLVEDLKAIGAKYGATPSQVMLAWLLAQAGNVIPIPGTTKEKYLKENLAALNIRLSPEDLQEVRKVAEAANASSMGARYPEFMMKFAYADTPELQ
ncbi:uncharacterized protein PHACADRAFT_262363 [Phanerochaete carnosa HHB-10118-sp]|uniref:NADP-dependent oxidoreductase domain-containing protein n=1 Tax=Phanerochaete carnosa (strain HHB-10118-sp) TaxID=650164 RepID=K5WNP7_PHACS|nr:uncharacterized protein PHACADRAFT_262363 [Phanerochaete carnosa HHB-10118-sp]EKM51942.1 hypothetical protein PHACADRAFT_262363 [Phanerochaete carnosa HHB-10118-sp]